MKKLKALVVGGTVGFGDATTRALAENYRVITVGRSGGDYRCDVGDRQEWERVCCQVVLDRPVLALVVCTVGYGRYVRPEELDESEIERTDSLNFLYVIEAYRQFSPLLSGPFVTIGSRWSYLTDEPCFAAYIQAKHRLRHWVEERVAEGGSCYNYCVPRMATPQYELVEASARAIYADRPAVALVDPDLVASSMCAHIERSPGGIYVIDSLGNVAELGQA